MSSTSTGSIGDHLFDRERKSLQKTFATKHEELRKVSELFKTTILHCRANGFDSHAALWNVALHVNLIAHDLSVLVEELALERDNWKRRLAARHVALVAYEAAEDVQQLTARNFRDALTKLGVLSKFEMELNEARKPLTAFWATNQSSLKEIRINSAAHRDSDAIVVLNTVETISIDDMLELDMGLGKVMNGLGAVLQRIINETSAIVPPEQVSLLDVEDDEGEIMRIEWDQILEGKQPDGRYFVDGVGQVFVDSTDIAQAQKLGGNPFVELGEATAANSPIPQFTINSFIPRSKDAQLVSSRDNSRLQALRRVFEAANGSTQVEVDWPDLVKSMGWSEENADDALFFLTDRRLLSFMALGPTVSLTRAGVDEVENAIRHPSSRTRFFSASTVQYINTVNNIDNSNRSVNIANSSVGAFQSGDSNIAHVAQQINPQIAEALNLLSTVRAEIEKLPPAQQSEATELADGIEAQVKAEKPSRITLKALIDGLAPFLESGAQLIKIYALLHGVA